MGLTPEEKQSELKRHRDIFLATKKLKVILLICQAFVFLGMGHGAIPILVLEMIWFDSIFFNILNFGKFSKSLMLVGLFSFIGQLFMILSIFVKSWNMERLFYVSGIFSLCMGAVLLYIASDSNTAFYIVKFSFIPFIIAVIVNIYSLKKNGLLKSPK